MQQRFSLRFESGERQGELAPIDELPFRVGRRPQTDLQISDGSVSGRHAELVADEDGALSVRDLKSTNGTRVGGEKVESARLAHGDALQFGNVRLVVVDRELDEAPAPATAAAGDAQDDVAVGSVSAEKLAKSGRRSRAPLLFGLAALLAAGGAAWLLLGGGGATGGGATRAVTELAGNLLPEGYSFEDADDESWSSDPEAPGSFLRRGDARKSGQAGMQAELEPGEHARLVSKEFAVREGQTLTVSAALRARDGVAGRVGVEFLRGDAGAGPIHVASAFERAAAEGGFALLELPAPVPPGSQRGRVVVEARAGALAAGSLDVDDVGVVSASGAIAPAAEVGDFDLFLLGEPGQALALYKLSKPFLGDAYTFARTDGAAPTTVTLDVQPGEAGRSVGLRLGGAGTDAVFSLRVEPELAAGGIASLGPSGYRQHGLEFDREDTALLILGSERDLVGLRFTPPVAVRGVEQLGGARVHVTLGVEHAFTLKLDFGEERQHAGDLAYAARQAEGASRPGEALRTWDAMLDEYPFDQALVAEAGVARGRLVQAGRARIAEARTAFDRASFFRLVDLFRRSHAAIAAVIADYEGTEVGAEAAELSAEVDAGLGVLETELDLDEVQRLKAIRTWLDASGSKRLAAEVAEYLASEYGVSE